MNVHVREKLFQNFQTFSEHSSGAVRGFILGLCKSPKYYQRDYKISRSQIQAGSGGKNEECQAFSVNKMSRRLKNKPPCLCSAESTREHVEAAACRVVDTLMSCQGCWFDLGSDEDNLLTSSCKRTSRLQHESPAFCQNPSPLQSAFISLMNCLV